MGIICSLLNDVKKNGVKKTNVGGRRVTLAMTLNYKYYSGLFEG